MLKESMKAALILWHIPFDFSVSHTFFSFCLLSHFPQAMMIMCASSYFVYITQYVCIFRLEAVLVIEQWTFWIEGQFRLNYAALHSKIGDYFRLEKFKKLWRGNFHFPQIYSPFKRFSSPSKCFQIFNIPENRSYNKIDDNKMRINQYARTFQSIMCVANNCE